MRKPKENQEETLRDKFAMAALNALATDHPEAKSIEEWNWDFMAETAYKAADAMLAARVKKKGSV